MGHLDVAPEPRAQAQTDVGALILRRVLRIDAHQAALGVLSVERTLRPAQDIHAVEHIEMVVERRLRHQRDIVVIDTHGRTVHTRADAADIHRRGEARAVGRHHERRHILRQLTQVAHIQLLQLLAAEDIRAHGLQAQTHLVLGLRHNNDLVEVNYFTGIGQFLCCNRRSNQ